MTRLILGASNGCKPSRALFAMPVDRRVVALALYPPRGNSGVVAARAPAAQTAGLDLIPISDLLSKPEEKTRWLVDRRLPAGGLSLLAGKPKAGKSTLARCLALAVARGHPWLDFPTFQGTVFYLGLEEKRAEVREHFQTMGASPEDSIKVFVAPSPQNGFAQLQQATEQEHPALIIVDPLIKLVRVKDANDYAAVTQALEPLLTLARESGAHILTVHHLGKGDRSGGDAILGSTAIFAAVDTALLLKRSERYRTLSSIQRYGEDLEEIVLTMDKETRIICAGPTRKDADEAQATEAILEYLAAQSEPVEEGAIHDAVEARRAVKQKALRRLVSDGEVVRTGSGKRGDPYRYSVSGIQVPTYIRVPENQKPKTLPSAHGDETYSGTRENATSNGSPHWRVPESEQLGLDGIGEPRP